MKKKKAKRKMAAAGAWRGSRNQRRRRKQRRKNQRNKGALCISMALMKKRKKQYDINKQLIEGANRGGGSRSIALSGAQQRQPRKHGGQLSIAYRRSISRRAYARRR